MVPLECLLVTGRKIPLSSPPQRVLYGRVARDDSKFGVLGVNSSYDESFPQWLQFYQFLRWFVRQYMMIAAPYACWLSSRPECIIVCPDLSFIRDEVRKIGFVGGNRFRDPQKNEFSVGKKQLWDRQKNHNFFGPLFWSDFWSAPGIFSYRLDKSEAHISSSRLKHSLTPYTILNLSA